MSTELSAEKPVVDKQLPSGEALPFYSVSLLKLCVLSVVSLSLYNIYWFYKSWKHISAASGESMRPFWRAVFCVFFCHSLAERVKEKAVAVKGTSSLQPGAIAISFFLLTVIGRLPDPYWLISVLSFVPLAKIVIEIRAVHKAMFPNAELSDSWSWKSYTALSVGAPCAVLLVLMVTVGVPTRVVESKDIPRSYIEELRERQIIRPDEDVEWFYSAGLFSIADDGNLLTPTRVISYQTMNGELSVWSVNYADIKDISIVEGSVLSNTELTVFAQNEDEIFLVLSAEDKQDRKFISELRDRANLPSR